MEDCCYTPVPVFPTEAGQILKELTFEAEKDKSDILEENEKVEEKEESTMRTLRIFLRNIITRLAQDKRFKEFTRPVDEEEVPDYYRAGQNLIIARLVNPLRKFQARTARPAKILNLKFPARENQRLKRPGST